MSKIDYTETAGIGYVTMNDPPGNKMNTEFFIKLKEITQLIKSDTPDGLIISGSGRHYSQGADLDDLINVIKTSAKTENGQIISYPPNLIDNLDTFYFFYQLDIPVVSVIKGICIGSGFELAMQSHFRFASDNALVGLPESSFGLMPGCGGISSGVRMVSAAVIMELALTGESLNSDDALKYGLIDGVYTKNDVTDKAVNFINTIKKDYDKSKKSEYLKILNTI